MENVQVAKHADCCSIKPHSKMSSSYYQEHQIEANALIDEWIKDEIEWTNV